MTKALQHWTVSATREFSYALIETEDVLSSENPTLARATGLDQPGPIVCVVDANLEKLYGHELREYFSRQIANVELLTLEVSEEGKNFDKVATVIRVMAEAGLSRRSSPVIAVGGGIVLDIVGLACSLYRRGVPYIRVPTSLIGMVDVAVGVKTAVNFEGYKSRIGSYHPPVASIIDPLFLATLPERHLANGLAEIVKISLVRDADLFELIEANAESCTRTGMHLSVVGRQLLHSAIENMSIELEPNLWEDVLERRADFGHSFSPSIEMCALPELLHGEAVAIDMALSTVLALRRGQLSAKSCDRILSVLIRLGLPLWNDVMSYGLIANALVETTRHRDGQARLPLLTDIGTCSFYDDVSSPELVAAISDLRARSLRVSASAS